MSSANEQVVRFERISAQFNADEGVVRFASQALAGPGQAPAPGAPINGNAISHAGGPYTNIVDNPNDPCALGAHYCTQPNMVCRVRQSTYSCECQDGYHFERDTSLEAGFRCVSSKHTSPSLPGHQAGCSGHHECHQWGECVAGQCKCRGWYVGDGVKHCGPPEETIIQPVDTPHKPQQACGEYTCDTNADCIEMMSLLKTACAKLVTLQWNEVCKHIGTICRGDRECAANARCVYNAQVNYYRCECLPSYTGDGVKCSQEISVAPSDSSCESKLGCHSQAICVANGTQPICQCNEGYFGDGRTCVAGGGSIVQPVVQPLEQCQDQSNCHPSAHCVHVESTDQYNCQCLPGYEGDGVHSCVHAEECSPSNDQSCSQNAKCLFSSNNQKFTCQCESGFTRQNGQCLPSAVALLDQPSQPSAVNAVCERCALEARCEQHPSNRQYTCVCNPGYEGNGYICTRPQPAPVALSCLDNRAMCSAYAQCVPNQQQTAYVCNCNYGYRGNGLVCEPVLSQQPQEDATLLIGRGMSLIQRSPINLEVPGKQLVVVPHQVVVDIAYDCHSKQIYWSDISGHSIRSVSLNGSNLQSSYSSELRSPEGIAIDWSSRNLYYVDSIRNELGVVSLDKSYQKALLTEGLVNPRALVIDMHNRHLYYSDWHRENPHIGRIDLDGSNNQVFVSEEVHLPNGLALLPGRRELCWVDAGSHRLSCIGLDGSGRRAVYAPLEYPFGLTCFQEQRFYWTDWNDHKIHSVSIYGDGYNVFAPGAGGKGKIYGILSLPLKCQEPPTVCATIMEAVPTSVCRQLMEEWCASVRTM
uniref:EGF-like domain-containing protein n=1 Tax=Ditylenchus dipsaci TaxID=166011 RepID=A0A915ESB5_9BILA